LGEQNGGSTDDTGPRPQAWPDRQARKPEEHDTSQAADKDTRTPRVHARVPLDQIDVQDALFVAMRRKIGKILAQLGPGGRREALRFLTTRPSTTPAEIETELRQLSGQVHADTVDLLLAGDSCSALCAPRARVAASSGRDVRTRSTRSSVSATTPDPSAHLHQAASRIQGTQRRANGCTQCSATTQCCGTMRILRGARRVLAVRCQVF